MGASEIRHGPYKGWQVWFADWLSQTEVAAMLGSTKRREILSLVARGPDHEHATRWNFEARCSAYSDLRCSPRVGRSSGEYWTIIVPSLCKYKPTRLYVHPGSLFRMDSAGRPVFAGPAFIEPERQAWITVGRLLQQSKL